MKSSTIFGFILISLSKQFLNKFTGTNPWSLWSKSCNSSLILQMISIWSNLCEYEKKGGGNPKRGE